MRKDEEALGDATDAEFGPEAREFLARPFFRGAAWIGAAFLAAVILLAATPFFLDARTGDGASLARVLARTFLSR